MWLCKRRKSSSSYCEGFGKIRTTVTGSRWVHVDVIDTTGTTRRNVWGGGIYWIVWITSTNILTSPFLPSWFWSLGWFPWPSASLPLCTATSRRPLWMRPRRVFSSWWQTEALGKEKYRTKMSGAQILTTNQRSVTFNP